MYFNQYYFDSWLKNWRFHRICKVRNQTHAGARRKNGDAEAEEQLSTEGIKPSEQVTESS